MALTDLSTDPAGLAGSKRLVEPVSSGGLVLVAGPDGAGKSTFCDALCDSAFGDRPVQRVHFRPGMLPFLTKHEGPVTDPHGNDPYGPIASALKTLYTFADLSLWWTLRGREFVRQGGWIVLERGWWDQSVDPRRYRLADGAPLVRSLGRLLPRPTCTFVLEAPVTLLWERKPELPLHEAARQMAAWRASPGSLQCVYLDSTLPVDELVATAVARIRGRTHPRPAVRWVCVPPSSSPRWMLPARSPAVTRGALRVYHPITLRSRIGWEFGRVLASTGIFRLMPQRGRPDPDVQELLDRHVGEGAAVALAKANHRGRYVALTVGPRGQPRRILKLATDLDGIMALERESRAIATLGASLQHPISAPVVIDHDDRVLVMSAVRWRTRLRPWRLPVEVAFAMGRFFASGVEDDAGPAHGDFAPWNLLRSRSGWVLIDWESARADAPPFYDVLHYLVQGHVLLGRPSLRALRSGLRGRGWVGRAIRAYAVGAGLAEADVRQSFSLYLDLSRRQLDASTADNMASTRARLRLAVLTERT
jgi:hypothetical protein